MSPDKALNSRLYPLNSSPDCKKFEFCGEVYFGFTSPFKHCDIALF